MKMKIPPTGAGTEENGSAKTASPDEEVQVEAAIPAAQSDESGGEIDSTNDGKQNSTETDEDNPADNEEGDPTETNPDSATTPELSLEVKPGETIGGTISPEIPDDVINPETDPTTGNVSWTVTTDEGGTETIKENVQLPDTSKMTLTKSTEDTVTKDGKKYLMTVETYESENEDGKTTYTKTTYECIDTEGEKDESAKPATTATQTNITKPTTETTTVEPGTVTVQMNPVENIPVSNGGIDPSDFKLTGATVTIKGNAKDGYAADIQLNLTSNLGKDGSMTVILTDEAGKEYAVNLDHFNEEGHYTLTGIPLGTESGEKQISLTLTGKQLKEIADSTSSGGSTDSGETGGETSGEKHFYNMDSGTETNPVKTELSPDKAQQVQAFLDSLKITEDFVVYADVYAPTNQNINHIDGNICVNEMNKLGDYTCIELNHDYGPGNSSDCKEDYVLNGYSYIGQLNDGAKIAVGNNTFKTNEDTHQQELATLVLGNSVSTENAFGYLNNADYVQLDPEGNLKADDLEKHPELASLQQAMQIDTNLTNIARTGQALIDEEYNSTYDKDTAKLEAAKQLLIDKALGKDDVMSITIGIGTLTSNNDDFNHTDYISNLINANTNGATIIINVDMSSISPDTMIVEIDKKMNGVSAYDGLAAHVIWNFGEYDGTLHFQDGTPFAGKVIAPKVTLELNEIRSGSAVGRNVFHNNELHMAVPGNPTIPTPTTPEPKYEEVETTLKTNLIINIINGKETTSIGVGDSITRFESETIEHYTTPDNPSEEPETPNTPSE